MATTEVGLSAFASAMQKPFRGASPLARTAEGKQMLKDIYSLPSHAAQLDYIAANHLDLLVSTKKTDPLYKVELQRDIVKHISNMPEALQLEFLITNGKYLFYNTCPDNVCQLVLNFSIESQREFYAKHSRLVNFELTVSNITTRYRNSLIAKKPCYSVEDTDLLAFMFDAPQLHILTSIQATIFRATMSFYYGNNICAENIDTVCDIVKKHVLY